MLAHLKNAYLEKIIYLLGAHKLSSITPLFLTLIKNAYIFMINHANVKNPNCPKYSAYNYIISLFYKPLSI
jgi:hypothetical protein